VSRIVILIAAENAARGSRLAASARDVGVTRVIRVDGLHAALEWLGHQTADILICGERVSDPAGSALLEAIRQASPATRVLWLPDEKPPESQDPEASPTSNALTSRLMLAAFLRDVVAPRPGFSCEVPELSLPDILQLYHQRRRSVSVLVSGSAAGRIRLEEGELVHAESGSTFGAAALSRLLESTPRLVRAELSPFDGRQTLNEPFHRVLLDAMNQVEGRRATTEPSGGEPPSAEPPSAEPASGGTPSGGTPSAEPASGGTPSAEPREGELDRRLLSAPAPELPMALPDARSFAPGRWSLVRRRPLAVATVLGSTMLVCALAGIPTARDTRAANPSREPAAEIPELAVSVERLQAEAHTSAVPTAPPASASDQLPRSPIASDAGTNAATVPSGIGTTLVPPPPATLPRERTP
jgi:hypothetical protein